MDSQVNSSQPTPPILTIFREKTDFSAVPHLVGFYIDFRLSVKFEATCFHVSKHKIWLARVVYIHELDVCKFIQLHSEQVCFHFLFFTKKNIYIYHHNAQC